MKNLILGLDGGATKSHLAIFDNTGKTVGTYAYGPLNHEVMPGSFDELEERLTEFIPRALKEAGTDASQIAYAIFGMAGADTRAQYKKITEIMRKTGIKDLEVYNDAFLGVAAGCPDCIGICAINGTGFKLAAIDHSGIAVETCGVGSYTDDRGGGTWYGLKAISTVYSELFKLGQPTLIREMIYKLAGITNREDYLEVVTEKFGGSGLNSVELNSIVFEAAALGDAAALEILDESAQEYAGAIARLILDLDFPTTRTVHVTLAGSVFVKQKTTILHDLIEEKVSSVLEGKYNVEYTRLDAPPVAGAVMWAAQKAGFHIEMPAIKEGIKGL